MSDSGEGRWTIAAAIDESVPAPVLSAALYERFSSRGEDDFADKVLSALRYQFGGHEEKAADREERRLMTASRSDALVLFGVDRRSRPQDDLPGALCDGETRRPQCPGHRRRLPEVESGAPAQARDRQHQSARAGSITSARFKHLLSLLRYVSGDYKDPGTFAAIKEGAGQRPASGALPRHPALAL